MAAALVNGAERKQAVATGAFQDFLGQFPRSQFFSEYLHRLPLALPDVGQSVTSLGTWSTVGSLIAAPGADLIIVRRGQLYSGERPVDLSTARRLSDDGYTIVVRHAELHDSPIAGLAGIFSNTFRAAVDVHVYATAPESFGFSWHYDAEDVFIFQCAGEKEYWLRKNTVNPWPLEETLPKDMRYEREIMPLMRVMLRAGDLLYIPCGYWHRAQATKCGETAISLAVGVMSRSAVDIFDLLRAEILDSLVWRQRLPLPGTGPSTEMNGDHDAYQHLLKQ